MGQFAARSGSGALPPRLTLARLGAALAASVLLHAGMLGSLGQLIGGAAAFHPGPRPLAGLRATLTPRAAPEPQPNAARADAPPARTASELAAPDAFTLFEGPRYFSAAELDRRPAPVSEIELDYPASGARREDPVVARILINEHGRVDRVQVLDFDPESEFDRAVIGAFAAGRYLPGMKNGRAVKSQMTVEVNFEALNPEGDTLPEPPVRRAPPAQSR